MILSAPLKRTLTGSVTAALLASLGGCQQHKNGPVVVDIIGDHAMFDHPLRHDGHATAQTLLAATAQGLLAFNAQGEVIGGLAESWIVLDRGQSYIFRLKRATWANGEPVKAEPVARLLQQRFEANPTMLAGLTPQVRAMTDQVVEIRLDTAVPTFLQLLAQPQFAILSKDGGTGPYRPGKIARKDKQIQLTPARDPSDEGSNDSDEPKNKPASNRILGADQAAMAVIRYSAQKTDLVLGGRFEDLLIVQASRQTGSDLRADPVPGLFGLAITSSKPLLADHNVRVALSQVIDRKTLADALGLTGWTDNIAILPGQLDLDRLPTRPDWLGMTMARRLAAARTALGRWSANHGMPPSLTVALPPGAGARLLYYRLADDLGKLGLKLHLVPMGTKADLRLIDAVAPFDSALWYLSELDCPTGISCDPAASTALVAARTAETLQAQTGFLDTAEKLIVHHAGYIPLGHPIRWSLVSSRLTGFRPSPRGLHPLNRLMSVPN